MTTGKDPFFIAWAPAAPVHRRRFLTAAGAVVLAGAAAAGAIAWEQAPMGPGAWTAGEVGEWRGWLGRSPYPHVVLEEAGVLRTHWLCGQGKSGVARRLVPEMEGPVVVRGSLIARGDHRMIAAADDADAIRLPSPAALATDPGPAAEEELGEALIIGEILDAKCWFGAMKPAAGKTHKACAALCARGGLPLAFCDAAACGDGAAAPLFLDRDGRAHGRGVLPYVADPLSARGRLVRVRDVIQFRVDLSSLRRV